MSSRPVEPVLLSFRGVTKTYSGSVPLRISDFSICERDEVILSGLDATVAEAFSLLATGASVPDEGDVVVCDVNTREIATDQAWLDILDRVGLVTERAVLLDQLSVAQNLALPITLAVEPMSPDVRQRVEELGARVGFARERLDHAVTSLPSLERMRLHLARALAMKPRWILLEHPTSALSPVDAATFGRTLQASARASGCSWLALSEDSHFAAASQALRLKLDHSTGAVERAGEGLLTSLRRRFAAFTHQEPR